MRAGHVLLAMLLLLPLASSAAPAGIAVQTWNYNPQTHTLTVLLVNNSHKEITAFNLNLATTFSDGTSDTNNDYSEDYLPHIAQLAVSPDHDAKDNGSWQPGAVKELNLPEPKDVSKFAGAADVVLYLDGSEEVSSKRAIEQIRNSRQGWMLGLQQASAVLKSGKSLAEAKSELRRLALVAHGTRGDVPESNMQVMLEEVANNLDAYPDLSSFANQLDAKVAIYKGALHEK